ncbi:MAG: SHOCT domain-containing protein [Saprospiraceae bacterium]
MIYLTWFILSIAIGFAGDHRKIGGMSAFFLSLFLSPLVGAIFTFSSKTKSAIAYEAKMLEEQQVQTRVLQERQGKPGTTIADELERLEDMRDAGKITGEEYLSARKKVLGITDTL